MIRSMKVQRKSTCQSQCFQEPSCVSYNYGPTSSDTPSCDLNNRTHLQASVDDFVRKELYSYRSILVRGRSSHSVFNVNKYIIFYFCYDIISNPVLKDQTKRNKFYPQISFLGKRLAKDLIS